MMSVLRMPLWTPNSRQNLSSLRTISDGDESQFLVHKVSHLSLTIPGSSFDSTRIRMGGGPRTYPGGVSKWQWKRMQAKKAKQLLKARLARERQIYEMRKRAELKAAISDLERPWEVVEKAPNLFSVRADEQLKVLADRFQRPGGFDMWSERDGPELFKPDNGLPSARFFPKGVVHSIKPYGKIEELDDGSEESEDSRQSPDSSRSLHSKGKDANKWVQRHSVSEQSHNLSNTVKEQGNSSSSSYENVNSSKGDNSQKPLKNRISKTKNRKTLPNGAAEVEFFKGNARKNIRPSNNVNGSRRRHGFEEVRGRSNKVYDLNLQKDGSYEFEAENRQ